MPRSGTRKSCASTPLQAARRLKPRRFTVSNLDSFGARATALLLDHVPQSNVLAEVTNTLPVGASLLSLLVESPRPILQCQTMSPAKAFDMRRAMLEAGQKNEVIPPAVPPLEVSINLRGLAADDAKLEIYVARLRHSTFFRNVQMTVNEIDASRPAPTQALDDLKSR